MKEFHERKETNMHGIASNQGWKNSSDNSSRSKHVCLKLGRSRGS